MNEDILIKLEGIHKQAITENSHYYTASTVRQAIDEIVYLRAKVKHLERLLLETVYKNWTYDEEQDI